MNNIYVDELPETCGKCRFIGHYEDGIYSRNPHCCCELYWDLHQEEIRVDKNSRDERCPLKLLSTRLAEERKKVIHDIDCELYTKMVVYGDAPSYTDIHSILNKIKENSV